MFQYSNEIIMILSALVVLSYLYNIVSRWLRIPAVLLLIGTGVLLHIGSDSMNIGLENVRGYVTIFGVVGLIMIVLEASLDLKLARSKLSLIRSAFLAAVTILLVSVAGLTILLHFWMQEPVEKCILYAIAMSIISSAIAIPSAQHLPERTREFIIYESSFSDILGIIAFNFLSSESSITVSSTIGFGGQLLIAIGVSVVASFVLFFLISRIQTHIKFFLLFALLMLIYTIGKMYHLPSLILILVFGLLINNLDLLPDPLRRHFHPEEASGILRQLKSITAETAFLIRTFFFVLFGYGIVISDVTDSHILELGLSITGVLLTIRFFYLSIFVRARKFPEVFFMPRGLITVLLFYSIPEKFKVSQMSEGILLCVIFATSILMMAGLMITSDADHSGPTSDYDRNEKRSEE